MKASGARCDAVRVAHNYVGALGPKRLPTNPTRPNASVAARGSSIVFSRLAIRVRHLRPAGLLEDGAREHLVRQLRQLFILVRLDDMRINTRQIRAQGAR